MVIVIRADKSRLRQPIRLNARRAETAGKVIGGRREAPTPLILVRVERIVLAWFPFIVNEPLVLRLPGKRIVRVHGLDPAELRAGRDPFSGRAWICSVILEAEASIVAEAANLISTGVEFGRAGSRLPPS